MAQHNKAHIGVGKTYLPGWINIDCFSNIQSDIQASALALPYPVESFDILYVSHLLEHFSRHLVLAALTHWRALLKPEGILRLAVPNFQAIFNHYQKHQDISILMGLLYGGQVSVYDFHKIVFDEKYLRQCLIKVGFREVRLWDWRDTDHAEFDDYSQCFLPHMDKANGLLMSLNCEAIK